MSKFKYLLVTSFIGIEENNDIITGEWRPLNMEINPFNLKPVQIINEKYLDEKGKHSDKSLLLIELSKN